MGPYSFSPDPLPYKVGGLFTIRLGSVYTGEKETSTSLPVHRTRSSDRAGSPRLVARQRTSSRTRQVQGAIRSGLLIQLRGSKRRGVSIQRAISVSIQSLSQGHRFRHGCLLSDEHSSIASLATLVSVKARWFWPSHGAPSGIRRGRRSQGLQ
ncbi:hypothetical protein VNO77_39062 [Canavalia gladiata]|uniref:Uncharacterized protein n=1 Tax=Canavalia gladiata TaxID=3824 RepID=A0AAN9KAD5_CANGL